MKKSQLTKISTVGLLSAFIAINSHAETQPAFKAKNLANIALPASEQMETERYRYCRQIDPYTFLLQEFQEGTTGDHPCLWLRTSLSVHHG